ncbi:MULTISPECIES: signal peptidase I [Bacillus]|uniref:signal peptidase I n=1 Tax=Bacillus TaxID=1386 RepID=UPI0004772263|nr:MULTISPECIES: signal peptidase I [Bacillus]
MLRSVKVEKSKVKEEVKSWIKSLVIAFAVVFLVRTFLFAPYTVDGSSMSPTLHNHEKMFVSKMNFIGDFKRGDIVIIKGDGTDTNYVKRIIGTPGDQIEMSNDQLLINGKVYDEPYLSENRKQAKQQGSLLTGNFGPLTVPDDQYFVMGDNRLDSMDSRNGLGYIQKDHIIGKAKFVFYPFDSFRGVE